MCYVEVNLHNLSFEFDNLQLTVKDPQPRITF